MKTDTLISIGGGKKINPTRILMLKADINYTLVFLDDGSKILSSTTIGVLEKRLEGYNFFRTHRSTIINMQYFSDFENTNKINDFSVIRLKNNTRIPLSRRKTHEFLKTIQLPPFTLTTIIPSKI
jgi:DNA-binding LytR/AlgR family response regulator